MSFVSLVFGLGGSQTLIGALTLDATLSEETELTSQITRYAVEDGDAPVTDHIVRDVENLTLSGVITSAGVTFFSAGGRSKLIAAKEVLRQIHEERIPITITTGSDIYENMGMGNARIGRSGTLERITVDCEFQKIRKVSLRTADIPPAKVAPKAKGKSGATGSKAGKVGESSTQVAPADGINQSTLDKMINGKRTSSPAPASGGIST